MAHPFEKVKNFHDIIDIFSSETRKKNKDYERVSYETWRELCNCFNYTDEDIRFDIEETYDRDVFRISINDVCGFLSDDGKFGKFLYDKLTSLNTINLPQWSCVGVYNGNGLRHTCYTLLGSADQLARSYEDWLATIGCDSITADNLANSSIVIDNINSPITNNSIVIDNINNPIAIDNINSSIAIDNTISNNTFYCTNKTSPLQKYYNYENKEEKEDKTMFNTYNLGPCTNDKIRMSPYGIAVQNTVGSWVSYDPARGAVIDVDIFNFDGRKFLYKIPVALKDIAIGDVIIHNRVPMFVVSIDGGAVVAIDPLNGEMKTILPTRNMFGFDFTVKVVSLFDFNKSNPTADTPFGDLLPLFMLDDKDEIDPMIMCLMMQNGTNNAFASNPMMLYMLMDKDGKNDNLLPLMLMMGGNK